MCTWCQVQLKAYSRPVTYNHENLIENPHECLIWVARWNELLMANFLDSESSRGQHCGPRVVIWITLLTSKLIQNSSHQRYYHWVQAFVPWRMQAHFFRSRLGMKQVNRLMAEVNGVQDPSEKENLDWMKNLAWRWYCHVHTNLQ